MVGSAVSRSATLRAATIQREAEARLRLMDHLISFMEELREQNERIKYTDYNRPTAPEFSIYRYECSDASHTSDSLADLATACRARAIDHSIADRIRYVENVLRSKEPEKGVRKRDRKTGGIKVLNCHTYQEFFILRASIALNELQDIQEHLGDLIRTGRDPVGIRPLYSPHG